ncbi:MAG: hypothetical protein M1814_000386 [Vezdaea aestivalis]|nr:MAG: hypothetical protein M1814_000386 [Vezdaea aestivalis]
MVPTTYSPHSPVGGSTLHLHSPTNLHDAAKAIRSIRRSLSRSPSKTPTFHLVSAKSPSPKSPLSPLARTPLPRSSSTTALVVTPLRAPSPLAVPFPPSAKVQKSSIRRSLSVRSTSRSRVASASPRRSALVISSDQGNSSSQQSSQSNSSQENFCSRSASPSEDTTAGTAHSIEAAAGVVAPAFAKSQVQHTDEVFRKMTASPRKRTEPIMNTDQDFCSSPAKRRSLHGATFDSDFQIFDQSQSSGIEPSLASPDVEMADARIFNPSGSLHHVSAVPRRTSSLRRSTLQQRQGERQSLFRNRPNSDLAFEFATPGPAASRNRPRLSLENYIQPLPRDSPFTSDALPSASVHLAPQRNAHQSQNPHPLSYAISQSSSANGGEVCSPFQTANKQKPDFSKSLPAGSLRPVETQDEEHQGSQTTLSSNFETPQNGKFVRPYAGAFMSTGLISKRNRTLEDLRIGLPGKRSAMPDTPCKRHTSIFPSISSPFISKIQGKSKQTKPEFGAPSTPFNPHGSKTGAGTFGKGMSIFGANITRRGSFISNDGDDNAMSPSRRTDSQSDSQTSEFDLPPTPTKRSFGRESGRALKSASQKTRKFGEQTSGNSVALPPTSAFGPPAKASTSGEFIFSKANTKQRGPNICPASVSPLGKLSFIEQATPHTPRDHVFPPDPSGLSISGKPHRHSADAGDSFSSTSSSSAIPATPTAARGYFDQMSNRRNSVTPVHTNIPVDVDRSLMSRFDKVELIGTGEFSEVYRISKAPRMTPDPTHFLTWSYSSARSSPRSFVADQIFAVKRSRRPYMGPRDRARKLDEVKILESLKGSDHIVQLVDQWEERNHLYIQTEFCEEGSLDLFLAQVGIKARLDDFRTWKVLLELSHGLQHIHDHGFIHLDLKPANVLITFEGVLKIADFGMATRWPAAAGIEGEGDREYIGPEVLLGQFDKPADIFALGLIMVEIAANVELPDNGTSWQKLRAGDMSDVPSLTWSPESNIFRDSSGNPIVDTPHTSIAEMPDPKTVFSSFNDVAVENAHVVEDVDAKAKNAIQKAQLYRHGELMAAPSFMLDNAHEQALDHLVRWMISPQPANRPVVGQLLAAPGLQWVEERKRAGATVFEGRWGPADEILRNDAEMMDF